MFIRKYEEVVETKVQSSNIWKLWQDPSSWYTWDRQLKAAFIEGSFNVGAKGFIEFHSGQKIDIKLILVDINKAFTIRMKLPLATMDFLHIYTKASENTKASIPHRMEFRGLWAPIWLLIIGRNLEKSLKEKIKKSKSSFLWYIYSIWASISCMKNSNIIFS